MCKYFNRVIHVRKSVAWRFLGRSLLIINGFRSNKFKLQLIEHWKVFILYKAYAREILYNAFIHCEIFFETCWPFNGYCQTLILVGRKIFFTLTNQTDCRVAHNWYFFTLTSRTENYGITLFQYVFTLVTLIFISRTKFWIFPFSPKCFYFPRKKWKRAEIKNANVTA